MPYKHTPESQLASLDRRLVKYRRIDPVSGCWLWTGNRHQYGYGLIEYQYRMFRVHRIAMWRWRGFDLDSKLYVCHRCDVRACFNPDHLFIGTASDNMWDKVAKGRHPRNARGKPRITPETVRAIRADLATGMTQTAIGAKHGVDQTTVSDIKTGRSRSDVV